ncbi:MAG: hypothetical protein JWO36_1523 [Myxococcales bacterium]|nr:hypothetical protein [Myxococcales bacterium]
MTRCVAIAVAALLAATPAWGHTFPPVRTVVVQVESCEVVLLVGYRPGTGEPTEAILARVASQPKSQMLDALRGVMTAYAMAPFTVNLDGKPLVPTTVRAKIGLESGGARPMVVVLVTYAMATKGSLSVTSRDPRSTQISWQDRGASRVDLHDAPAQGKRFNGVASFLLSLSAPTGDSCATSQASESSR